MSRARQAKPYPHGGLRHRWRIWASDGWADPLLDLEREWTDRLVDRLDPIVSVPLIRATCAVLGHEVTQDMCRMPEHDYCHWCRRTFPDQALPPACVIPRGDRDAPF